jgi:hypothetical protein
VDSTSGTVNLDANASIKDIYAARIQNSSSGQLREDITGGDDLYVSFYLRLNALPSSRARIALVTAGGVTVGNVQLRTNGALRLRNDATQVGADSAPLSVGKIYRIGLRQKRGTGNNAILEAYLAVGDAPFGTPFATNSTQTFTARASRVSFGATNSIAIDGTFDDISIDTAAMPQPTPPQPLRINKFAPYPSPHADPALEI